MKLIRVVVVDDEPLARSRIVKLLQKESDIQIVGECKNGQEATSVINSKEPDLIFLDIQMPDMNGFQVFSKINPQYRPIVIFITAYDQYALKAFDIHAVDYLLKPFDNERFREALEIARKQIKMTLASDFNKKLLRLLKDFQHED